MWESCCTILLLYTHGICEQVPAKSGPICSVWSSLVASKGDTIRAASLQLGNCKTMLCTWACLGNSRSLSILEIPERKLEVQDISTYMCSSLRQKGSGQGVQYCHVVGKRSTEAKYQIWVSGKISSQYTCILLKESNSLTRSVVKVSSHSLYCQVVSLKNPQQHPPPVGSQQTRMPQNWVQQLKATLGSGTHRCN